MKNKVSFQLLEKKIVRDENELETNEIENEYGVVEHSKAINKLIRDTMQAVYRLGFHDIKCGP